MKSTELLADKFTRAFYERAWSGALEPPVSDLSLDEAYAVQNLVADMRVRGGEQVVGFKVGCTSEAIRSQFGLTEPISGRLFSPHVFSEGITVDFNDYANCAIEPEMVLTIGVDLFGTFLGCRLAIPHLEAAGGGSIINTTSIRALTASQGADAYTAAKGGVLTLTKALAQELAPLGIRVNAIAPGVVGTERVLAMISDDNPIVQKSLLGICDPEDVAWMALYLASDESRRVTGAILPVDSGASAV